MGNTHSIGRLGTITKQGRWALKNHKHIEINSYWNNIDNCGDIICGNLQHTKQFLDKEIQEKERDKIKDKHNINN